MRTVILVFAFNRPDLFLQSTLRLEKELETVDNCDVWLYVDGPRDSNDQLKVSEVNQIAQRSIAYNKIEIAEHNKGLRSSLINGITEAVNTYESFIVLEDDILLHDGALEYTLKILRDFKDNNELFIFSLFSYWTPFKNGELYSTRRFLPWGWASWSCKWKAYGENNIFNVELRPFYNLFRYTQDLSRMCKAQGNGKINSWYISVVRFMANEGLYSLHSSCNLVDNIGFNVDTATHTTNEQLSLRPKIDKIVYNNSNIHSRNIYVYGYFTVIYKIIQKIYFVAKNNK